MSNRYQLVSVENAALVAGLAQLVQRSNELTAEVLAHLAELEERMLYARDQGQCSFVSASGRRCQARARLELDHVEPWALRG
jgi:hypothetical protein